MSAGANDFGWTDGGSTVPAEKSIGDAFAKLFAEEGAARRPWWIRRMDSG